MLMIDKKKNRLIIYIVSACVITFIFCGCKTTQYIPVETVKTVYKNTTDTIRDSIKHEVFVKEYVKGDSFFVDRVEKVFVDRWRIRDSIMVVTDSVPIPYPVEKIVEKPVTPWYNWLLISVLLCAFLYLLLKRIL